jgi:hypothetical protein
MTGWGGGEIDTGAGDRCASRKPIHKTVEGACTMRGRRWTQGTQQRARGKWKQLEAKDTHPNHCHEQLVHPRGVAAVGKPGCKAHGHQTAQLPLQRRALQDAENANHT